MEPIEEPQAEAKLKPQAEPGTSRALAVLPEILEGGPLLLNPAVPFDNAQKLIEAYHWHAGERVRTLMHYQHEYWKWDRTHWAVLGDDSLRAGVGSSFMSQINTASVVRIGLNLRPVT